MEQWHFSRTAVHRRYILKLDRTTKLNELNSISWKSKIYCCRHEWFFVILVYCQREKRKIRTRREEKKWSNSPFMARWIEKLWFDLSRRSGTRTTNSMRLCFQAFQVCLIENYPQIHHEHFNDLHNSSANNERISPIIHFVRQ